MLAELASVAICSEAVADIGSAAGQAVTEAIVLTQLPIDRHVVAPVAHRHGVDASLTGSRKEGCEKEQVVLLIIAPWFCDDTLGG